MSADQAKGRKSMTPDVSFHTVERQGEGYTPESYLQFDPPSRAGEERKWLGPVLGGIAQDRSGNYQPPARYW
jgi:hypothetical protein